VNRRTSDVLMALGAVVVFAVGLAAQKDQPVALAVGTGPATQAVPAPNSATSTTVDPFLSIVAQASIPKVGIYDSPSASQPSRTLDSPQPSGAPLVFLVKQSQKDWLNVHLPVRPNGSTGWIHRADVILTQHNFRIVVELNAHRITVTQGPNIIDQEPIAVGRGDTPTPGGTYYIKELLRPPDPTTVYGPYAYGLSGFSNVLQTFNGGSGVIGIHGNNDASVLGKDVSHGCIRMSNPGIEKLVKVLPLGVPVEIKA
jgi:lipoprotein-anchoring transpeptidase ErfK/SrfK